MTKFSIVISLVIVGIAAAMFGAPAPRQVSAPLDIPRGGALFGAKTDVFDEGLDNAEIAADSNITPARKCGFCMG